MDNNEKLISSIGPKIVAKLSSSLISLQYHQAKNQHCRTESQPQQTPETKAAVGKAHLPHGTRKIKSLRCKDNPSLYLQKKRGKQYKKKKKNRGKPEKMGKCEVQGNLKHCLLPTCMI